MPAKKGSQLQEARVRWSAPRRRSARKPAADADRAPVTGAALVLEEARRAGLLAGGRTQHVSFRVPRALVEAAKRQSGVTSPTALGILALATLAQPDPVAAFFKRTYGRLGRDHTLDY